MTELYAVVKCRLPYCNNMVDNGMKTCPTCLIKVRAWPSTKSNPKRNKVCAHNIKLEALEVYGKLTCKCCGETNIAFLTLDHVNNDGYLHKKITEGTARRGVRYRTLKNAGWPNDPPLQVLCWNCNCGKRINGGICPHQVSSMP